MKRLNPLYLLFASLLVLIILIAAVSSKHAALQEAAQQSAQLKQRVEEITRLKSRYADTSAHKRKFLRLSADSRIKSAITDKSVKHAGASLTLSGLGSKEAEWFLETLFNDGFRIKTLELKQVDKKISIETEVLF